MKKIFFMFCTVLVAIIFALPAFASEYAISEDIVRFVGRTNYNEADGELEMNWPMSGFEFKFSGTSAKIYVSEWTSESYINVSIDGVEECERIKLTSEGEVIIAKNLSNSEHTVKVTRSNEANDSSASFLAVSSIETDGTSPVPTTPKARRIEVIGDSYSVGYGNLEKGDVTT